MSKSLLTLLVSTIICLSAWAQTNTPLDVLHHGHQFETPTNPTPGGTAPVLLPQGSADLSRTIDEIYGGGIPQDIFDEIRSWHQNRLDPDWWMRPSRNDDAEWRNHRTDTASADNGGDTDETKYPWDLIGMFGVGIQHVNYTDAAGLQKSYTLPQAYILDSNYRPDAFSLYEVLRQFTKRTWPTLFDAIHAAPVSQTLYDKFHTAWPTVADHLVDPNTQTMDIDWLPEGSRQESRVRYITWKLVEFLFHEEFGYENLGTDTDAFFNSVFSYTGTNLRARWKELVEQDIANRTFSRGFRTNYFLGKLTEAEKQHFVGHAVKRFHQQKIIFVIDRHTVHEQYQTLADTIDGTQYANMPLPDFDSVDWNLRELPSMPLFSFSITIDVDNDLVSRQMGEAIKGCFDGSGSVITDPEVIHPLNILLKGSGTMTAELKMYPTGLAYTLLHHFTHSGSIDLEFELTPEGSPAIPIANKLLTNFRRFGPSLFESDFNFDELVDFTDVPYNDPSLPYNLTGTLNGKFSFAASNITNLTSSEIGDLLGAPSSNTSATFTNNQLTVSGLADLGNGNTETRSLTLDFTELLSFQLPTREWLNQSFTGWDVTCPEACGPCETTSNCDPEYCERPSSDICGDIPGSFWSATNQTCECPSGYELQAYNGQVRCVYSNSLLPADESQTIFTRSIYTFLHTHYQNQIVNCEDIGLEDNGSRTCYELTSYNTLEVSFSDSNGARSASFDPNNPGWFGTANDPTPGQPVQLPGYYDFTAYMDPCQSENPPAWCDQIKQLDSNPATQQPDLSVTSVTLLENALPGQPLQVQITVQNIGEVTAPNSRLSVRFSNASGEATLTDWVGSLRTDESRTYIFSSKDVAFNAVAGTNEVDVDANSDNAFSEAVMYNNNLPMDIQVTNPYSIGMDLRALPISANDDHPVAGQTVTFLASFSNRGFVTTTASQYLAWVSQNGNVIASQIGDIPALANDGSYTASLDFTFPTAGQYTINFLADLNSDLVESNETNNLVSRSVTIQTLDKSDCYECQSRQTQNAIGTELCLASPDGTEWTGSMYRCMGLHTDGASCSPEGVSPNGWREVGPRCPDPNTLPPGMHPDRCGNPNVCPGQGSAKRSQWIDSQQTHSVPEILTTPNAQ